MTVGHRALEITLLLSAPLLLTALVVGLLVGVFQAATQINEMTLSFIPKLIATAAALAIAGPWMIKLIVGYTRELFESIPECWVSGWARTASMLNVTTGQLEGVGGAVPVAVPAHRRVRDGAPIFGANFVPPRYRIALAGAITLLVAPLLTQPDVAPFSPTGLVIAVQQIMIGVAARLRAADHLRFARHGRPAAGEQHGSVVRLQRGSAARCEHAGAGAAVHAAGVAHLPRAERHLALMEVLVEGFRSMPVGTSGFDSNELWMIAAWGTQMFRGALAVALPGMTALLIVNLAFGVVSRAAPTLNLFAIGSRSR